MRVLGLDLGTKRVGVALSDPTGTIASPYEVLARSGSRAVDHRRIAELVEEVGAERVVVGLPRSLSGAIGPAARAALEEIDALGDTLGVPVEAYDERLTTVSAERALREADVRGKNRRAVVDKVAAAVMLQAWLDGRARA
ncbi:MAG: Holliday junction resolvase RuvX [Acidimicrobiales bacterium]|nr:Holliday junction resolvase RuvX [Acidimicrobiales bacterium]